MIYTDGVHMIADSLSELHEFAKEIGLKRMYFHGVKKKHPHYDLLGKWKQIAIDKGAIIITTREIINKIRCSA